MSGSTLLSAGQGSVAALPISAGYLPPEGSRVISALYSWTSTNREYTEDVSFLVGEGLITTIQAMFVDNSLCQFPVAIQILGTNQTFIVGALSQAVYPVFFTGGPRYKVAGISSNSEGSIPNGSNDNTTRVMLLNYPVSPAQWSAAGSVIPSIPLFRNNAAVADGASVSLFASFPSDARLLITGLQVSLDFGTAPTGPGTALFQISDAGFNIYGQRISWVTGETSVKTVSLSNLGYLQRAISSAIAVKLTGFPVGAAGLTIVTSTFFTAFPQVQ